MARPTAGQFSDQIMAVNGGERWHPRLSHAATAVTRYAAGMTLALTLLQTEVHRELPIPAWAFGVLAFGLLLILLLITWSIGKGRPHS